MRYTSNTKYKLSTPHQLYGLTFVILAYNLSG